MVVQDNRVDRIAAQAKNTELPDFDMILKNEIDCSFDEVLQKLAILNHLYERDIELYLYYGQEKALFN